MPYLYFTMGQELSTLNHHKICVSIHYHNNSKSHLPNSNAYSKSFKLTKTCKIFPRLIESENLSLNIFSIWVHKKH